ncbi:MAG: hypothetical protein KF819_25135 [Labilithrix sp.]|nr:hypothetical protein [Labilithrix sp.]
MAQKLEPIIGAWGRPPDNASMLAAAAAVAALLICATGRGGSLLGLGPYPIPRRLFLWITGFIAALLSIFYIAFYLRGGPRIIDATTYFLQGRALSHGDFAWSAHDPTASFRGRFLLHRDGVMGGIFPPGYPLLLAAGFTIGAPMVVGPALAAAIVVATYRLAHAIAEDAFGGPHRLGQGHARHDTVETVARSAALLSVVCAALRYHTADTMSHGAAALGVALALEAALRGRMGIAGLCVGGVIATRPITGLAIGIVVAALLWRSRSRARLQALALGLLPGLALLAGAQHAVTGAWGASTQKMYYAMSDGPPGCFRWGFGSGVGCLHEHGEFVAARLPHGYGPLQSLLTTLRRLKMHLLDVASFEPFALLLLAPLIRPHGSRAIVAAGAAIGLQILAYAPFYFDGNYPGGGARLFADVLPIEHALLAIAIARLASRHHVRGVFAAVAVSLAGFALHASFEHVKLAEREGGKPMFEPDLLARASVNNGLVFVDTDHGFGLGHDPHATTKNGVVVARLRQDDRDRLLYDRLDHPTTYLYKFDIPPLPPGAAGAPVAAPVIVPWAPPALGDPLRFEAEAEWPPLSQRGGFAAPAWADACASGSRALVLTPAPIGAVAVATISVPVPEAGRYAVGLRVVQGVSVPFTAPRGSAVVGGAVMIGKTRWDWVDVPGAACADLAERELPLEPPAATLTFEARGGPVALDRVTLKRRP